MILMQKSYCYFNSEILLFFQKSWFSSSKEVWTGWPKQVNVTLLILSSFKYLTYIYIILLNGTLTVNLDRTGVMYISGCITWYILVLYDINGVMYISECFTWCNSGITWYNGGYVYFKIYQTVYTGITWNKWDHLYLKTYHML
jgi:hypothetical protein